MRPLAIHRVHALPKQGHRAEEYEDATAGPMAVDVGVRAAVTDGATEAAFSGVWARALAEAAVRLPLSRAIEEARAAFDRSVEPKREGMPWYAALKADEGAFATALALTVNRDGTWSAEAVGDSALLHLREGALVQAWPLDDPDAFDSRPALAASRADLPLPEVLTAEGSWQPGDRLLLATDALAAYLLRTDPTTVCNLDAHAFAAFITAARRQGLRNDDVTLVELVVAK